jgi:hypothetical protein
MIVLEPLRWLLTAAFAAVAAYHLAGYARPRHAWRPLDVPHLLMGPAMIVMIWPWGRSVPAGAWMILFGGSAGWFLAEATWSRGRHRYVPTFSASAAAAMLWMGAAPSAVMHAHADMPMSGAGPVNWVSVTLGAYLVMAAMLWLIRGLGLTHLSETARPAAGRFHWATVCHGIMSAAMGLALLAMP